MSDPMASAIAFSCSFMHENNAGMELAKGEAQILLEDERLSILPKFGETIHLSLVDITEILPGDYRAVLALSSGEKLSIFDLGYKFGDFLTDLFRLRNEMMLKYLLMNESIKKSGITCDLTYADEYGVEKRFDGCEVRLYETYIVFIPTLGEPLRVHFSNISQADANDYSLSISTDLGERFAVSRMGKEFDNTAKSLSDALNDQSVRVQSLLKDMIPSADPAVIRNLARLLKDGKAAKKVDVESVSPEAWNFLERKLGQTSIWDAYQYLKSMARQEKIAVGIKRGLMGDLTGNYLWLLIPIYGHSSEFGNAVALESVRLDSSDQDSPVLKEPELEAGIAAGGSATYFFRIAGRKDYAGSMGNVKELDAKVDGMISKMNQLMLDINFRREPIFLSDEKLRTEPKYARYRFAAQKIPSLQDLRRLFIGRVIHSSFEQWKTDVSDLLSFNASSNDDNSRWEKS